MATTSSSQARIKCSIQDHQGGNPMAKSRTSTSTGLHHPDNSHSYLSSNKDYSTGLCRGAQGEQGEQGAQGERGEDG